MKCILNVVCKEHNTEQCNLLCPSFLFLHGKSGKGGRLGASMIPKDYQFYTIKNNPVKEQPQAEKLIRQYVDTFTRQFGDYKRIKSLYLYSAEPGTGKTTMSIVILNEYMIRHYVGALQRNLKPLQRPCYFFDVNEWQQYYNGFARSGIPEDVAEKSSNEYYRREQFAKVTPFVVFDDIGVRQATDGFRGDLHTMINYRVSNRYPAVYTSNVHIDELGEIYDERLADRIREECLVIEFKGASKRGFRK